MIKAYKNLNYEEKEKVYEFIKIEDKSIKSLDEIESRFNCKIYDYGNGVLFYFKDSEIIGSICIVLEVAKEIETAYIHKLNIDKNIDNRLDIIQEMINEGVKIGKLYGAKDIRLGINEKDISNYELEKLNLDIKYRSLEMVLKDTSVKNNILKLEKLNEENKLRYLNVYNKSFRDMPHGTIIDIETLNNNLRKISESNYYFIVLDDCDNEIGFMEANIENDRGIFDIGLKKEYRGNGYGKRLLETAIQFLGDKEVKETALIVIEENKIAFNMYKKRGFEISKVIGHWVVL